MSHYDHFIIPLNSDLGALSSRQLEPFLSQYNQYVLPQLWCKQTGEQCWADRINKQDHQARTSSLPADELATACLLLTFPTSVHGGPTIILPSVSGSRLTFNSLASLSSVHEGRKEHGRVHVPVDM